MSTACACRGFAPQAQLIERSNRFLRAVSYTSGSIVGGKGISRTAVNREVGARRAPTLCFGIPGQAAGGSGPSGPPGGTGGGGAGGGGGGGGASSGGNARNLAFLFAALLAVGGFMGYKKKGSTASLKASGGFAAVLVLAGYLIGGPYTTVGLGLALAVNVVLGYYMAKGYSDTRKVFPQLVFSVICAVNTFTYAGHLKTSLA